MREHSTLKGALFSAPICVSILQARLWLDVGGRYSMLGQRYARGDTIPGRAVASGIRVIILTCAMYIARSTFRVAVEVNRSSCGQ